jgi:hypothetical protein
MIKLFRRLIKFVIGLLVVLIILAVVAVLMLDHIAKVGIEKGCTYMLGVNTTVEHVHISLFAGQFHMDDLIISNPPNFSETPFVKLGNIRVHVTPESVTSDTIKLTLFELDGLDLLIEQHVDGSNTKTILDTLESRTPESSPSAKKDSKRFQVDRIVVRNVNAHIDLYSEVTKRDPVTISIPEIIIEDLDSDNADGLLMEELVQKILPAVIEAVLKEGGDLLPEELTGPLLEQLSGLTESIGLPEDFEEDLLPKTLDLFDKLLGDD